MAYKGMVILLLVTVFCAGAATAQSSCTNVFISLLPCVNYVTGISLNPSTQCCSNMASVVKSSRQCLCQVVLNGGDGGASSLGININRTRALATPGACNIQTPPVSLCNAAASPAKSPASVPESPATIPTGDGRVSTTVQSVEDGISDASSIKLSTSLLFLLLAAFYVSIFHAY